MSTTPLVVFAFAIGLLVTPAQADDSMALSLTILSATVEGPIVRGVMEVTVVNHRDYALEGLTLRLDQPNTGTLGDDGVDLGDVAMDGTARATTDFSLDTEFLSSDRPYSLRATFRDAAGQQTESVVMVSRQGGGL